MNLTKFADQYILQMRIIKVDATTSTNELSKALNGNSRKDNFCVSAEFQMKGRGQQNTSWQSTASQNLTFTVVYNTIDLDIDKSFCLNAMVCLSIYNVLKTAGIKDLSLKWPNDIMADNYKVGGILIENSIVGTKIKHSYVGIGLNVNQTKFENLPQASSLKKLTGMEFDRNHLLDRLLEELQDIPRELHLNTPQNIINVYKRYVYRFNTVQYFVMPDSSRQKGKIKDVGLDGKLQVTFESGESQSFEHKAIRQTY